MRLARLVERELCPHDGPYDSAFQEAEDVLPAPLAELRVPADQPAEVEAVHADVAADEPGRAHVLPEPACVPDRDRGSHRLKEGERRGEDVAADEVEDRVDRVELAEVVVGDRLDRAERARQLELLLA